MYFNTITRVVSAATATVTFTTNISVLNVGYAEVQAVWTSHGGGNATVSLLGSLDGTNFNSYQSSSVSISSGSSSQIFSLPELTTGFLQVSYAPGTNNSGTIDLYVCKKGHV